MTNLVTKDPNFPLEHVQVTELKSKGSQLFEKAQKADLVITRQGETLGYVVNPAHYQFFIDMVTEAGERATKVFLETYAKRHGGLTRLDAAVAQARRGDFITPEQEAELFGDE